MKHLKWSEQCIVKKTGDGYTVWFPPSQSFAYLKGPAYEAFRLIEKGEEDKAILQILINQTGSTENEISGFIKELNSKLDWLMDPENLHYAPPPDLGIPEQYTFIPYSEKYYHFKGFSFCFLFESNEMFQQFNPLLSHLAIDNPGKTDFIFELFTYKKQLVFRFNGRLIENFRNEHIHYLKGAVMKKMAGLIYGITDENWMASLHASAVSDGKKAMLFSAQPGGGKSTVAALLQARGYLLLSDDFITLDKQTEHVWQMPMAMSIKEGSLSLLTKDYPQLNDFSSNITPSGKEVHYLPPCSNEAIRSSSFKVKSIIFIQYAQKIPFQSEKIEPEEAIMNLLAETWVNPKRETVEQFLNWFEQMDCVRINYSDHEKLLEDIDKRFQS